MSDKSVSRKLREDASAIVKAALAAVDAEQAVKRYVKLGPHGLIVGGEAVELAPLSRIITVGAGKASAAMAKALEDILGDRISEGLVCVKYGHSVPLRRVKVVEAGHPVPDEAGVTAGRAIVDLLGSVGPNDLVIACISGGGSALLVSPADGISLTDKKAVTNRLLNAGASISEMNTVRKHMSAVKGGRLMQAAYPARTVILMLSDVVGDDPAVIASGPCAPDPSTYANALTVLQRYGVGDRVFATVEDHLRRGKAGLLSETPKPGDHIFRNVPQVIVASNIQALEAAKKQARDLGYEAVVLSSSVQGDTREAAAFHAAIAREVRSSGNPVPPPACILTGGETTVRVAGDGLGGRNQEFCLSLVRDAARIPGCLFAVVGTDGSDGPTDAAGALVDDATLARATAAGLDPDFFLENNDSYHFFEKLGDLVITGPTRTNVMDVRVILLARLPTYS
ncbi:MAG: glycerate kinase [Pseudomonadota bacterium]